MESINKAERLKEVAGVFLKLGATAFGGPAAHIAMMEQEIVQRRKWVSRETFLDLLGATNLIPGPNSTELAIHLGFVRAGWFGLIVAGSCFILPAMAIVWMLAAFYVHYQTLPELSHILWGIKPVIIAIVVQALWNLTRTAIKGKAAVILGIIALLTAVMGFNEIVILLVSGLLMMLFRNRTKLMKRNGMHSFIPVSLILASGATAAGGAQYGPLSHWGLFWAFLKIGSVLYGSGYVLLAFLQSVFVDHYGSLTSQQLLDSVAVGQFTPGPVFTTATFVGYIIHGNFGAVLATLAIFLPAFIFVAMLNPWVPRLRKSAWFGAFLDGVNIASLALMASVSYQLSATALVNWLTWLLAAASLYLLVRFKLNSVWLVIGGGLLGWVYFAVK